jgi:hypothetical protein
VLKINYLNTKSEIAVTALPVKVYHVDIARMERSEISVIKVNKR